jgi:hypothetical protein
MTDERILDKVKKLLALANDAGASEGERDNALRMAHGLLAKHNLAMVDLEAHEQQEGREQIKSETFGMQWCRSIARDMAKLFFCKSYLGDKLNSTKQVYYFVGKQSNAITAQLMTEYLVSNILKECRKRYGHNLAPESRSFALGAADTIGIRVYEMMKSNKPFEGVSAANALVIHELYKTESEANDSYIAKNVGKLVKYGKNSNARVNSAHFEAGSAYGSTINLNSQLANPSRLRIK